MTTSGPPPATVTRPVTAGMRWMLLIASVLVFTIGISLFGLTEQTDRFFAWTIQPPLTAAFLGAAYWASFALEFLASRERAWARARVAVPAVLVFTALTLIVTLIHLDRFHLGGTFAPITRLGTWVWLAVYAIVPLVLTVLWIGQARVPGADPPRRLPIPPLLRALLIVQAVGMLALGAALLVAPLAAGRLWPWMLTALTGRAVGAWLIGLGIAAAHMAWEDDWWRIPAATAAYTIFGGLQLLALARYPRAVDWAGPRVWVYLLFLLSMSGIGLYGWWVARRAAGRPAPGAALAPPGRA